MIAEASTSTIDPILLLSSLTAFKEGDFSTRLPIDGMGLTGKIYDTLNDIFRLVDHLANELAWISTTVGKEGKVNHRASLGAAPRAWISCIDSINGLIGDVVRPLIEVTGVIEAVTKGDLSQRMAIAVEGHSLEGQFLHTAQVINTMIQQLNSFASEVTRVAKEVGTHGKLGGQADVKDVFGAWKDLTESVNSMASNLTVQVRNISKVTSAVAKGDLTTRITVDARGEILELKNTLNTMVDQLSSFAYEVTRVAREVGTEGKLGGQAVVTGVGGVWRELTESVNSMAGKLTEQVRNIAEVTTAVAKGDLSRKITVDVQGEILELKNTINTMVDQLNGFANEVTRVAREVGSEGILGGQADVQGVSGTWKGLTESVNSMAGNLTAQVRNIAEVTTAVAKGDLSTKIAVDARGEIMELKSTINTMVDQLSSFASEVTRVAREVGSEGRLGGQAHVPGAGGIWRDLTDNVNELAANLTRQVRAIADVATAVTQGNLTRSIAVEAQGEVAALKDNINRMIGTLAETTRQNKAQDWVKTNIANFMAMMQGQRDLPTVSQLLLKEMTPLVEAQQSTFYWADSGDQPEPVFKILAAYAFTEGRTTHFRMGEGLVGQCALQKERILLRTIPHNYLTIGSSLGESSPANLILLPVLFEGEAKGVIELASFQQFSDIHLALMDQITESLGIVLNTIAATMQTENLLKQSQALAEQLQQTNAELQDKAQLLAEQKNEVENKNREVEQAKANVEEKAEQLRALSASSQSAREEEGMRIAREIHDELGASLTSLKWDLEALDKTLLSEDCQPALPPLREKIDAMMKATDNTITTVRRIASELRPTLLDDLGLLEAIEWQAQNFQERTGIACNYECSLEEVCLNRDQSTVVFRIFQEALTNILRHAQATRVEVVMEYTAGEFVLTIRDNGRGITEEEKTTHLSLGILGMQERAHLVGGRVDVVGAPGHGTLVAVRIHLSGAPVDHTV